MTETVKVANEIKFVASYPGVAKLFDAYLVGSWAKQDADKMPDRNGINTSDFDVILTPKPSTAKGLAKFQERDERSQIIEAIKAAWNFARKLQIHEGDVATTSKAVSI